MSVILDALHKARGDKRNPQPEVQPRVARVLDAGVASEAMLDSHNGGGARPRRAGRGGGAVTFAIVLGVLCLCLLAGGAFFLLYSQGKRLEESRAAGNETSARDGETASGQPPLMTTGDVSASGEAAKVLETGLALPPAPALPTPLALSDLPVQPPQPKAALSIDVAPPPAAAGAVAQAGVAPTAAQAPAFKLGSIVCENDDCLASLNGRTVRVGDEIRQYQVLRITSKEVTLKSISGNDVITLSLFD